jgi:hypothetical protein
VAASIPSYTRWRAPICALLLFVACGRAKRVPLQDLSGRENLSYFTLFSLRGSRNGDRLDAQAAFSDSSSILNVEMRFAVGPTTTLASGTWRWPRNNTELSGAVRERSVTFLGGQDGPPSIGGTFDLLGQDGTAQYRVTIPLSELKARLY